MRLTRWFALALSAGCSAAQATPSSAPPPLGGTMPSTWYAGGATCAGRPAFRVHEYAEGFFILRQPACTNFEKPFLYLIIGSARALLLDQCR